MESFSNMTVDGLVTWDFDGGLLHNGNSGRWEPGFIMLLLLLYL